MGVYRTAIVQGLSIAHGRGERRQFCPVKTEVISITLKDMYAYPTLSRIAISAPREGCARVNQQRLMFVNVREHVREHVFVCVRLCSFAKF